MSTYARATTALAVAAAAGAAAWLAPTTLGGSATWVRLHGSSMQPELAEGDLVIARPAPPYEVGDVVAYHSPILDTVVLHRIVAERGGAFRTAGHNTDLVDPGRVRTAEVLGEPWLHVPGGGSMLDVLTDPVVILALVLPILLAGGLAYTRTGSRTGPRASSARPGTARSPSPGKWSASDLAVGAAVLALAIGALAFSRPATEIASREIPMQNDAEVRYSASVDVAGVYDDRRLLTGDPVFLPLASVIDVQMHYRLVAQEARVTGTVVPRVEISAGNGWSHSHALGPQSRFTGQTTRRAVQVDFNQLIAIARRAERRAGVTFGGYTADVVFSIRLRGAVDGEPVKTTYASRLSFSVDPSQALPQTGVDHNRGAPIRMTADATQSVPSVQAATAPVLRWDVPVGVLRLLAGVLVLTTAAAAAWSWRRREEMTDVPDFGERLVQAHSVDLEGRPIVDVETPGALAVLAERFDAVVVQLDSESVGLYLADIGGTIYRCVARTDASASTDPVEAEPAGR